MKRQALLGARPRPTYSPRFEGSASMLKLCVPRTYLLAVLVLSCIGAAPVDGNMCPIEKAVIHHMQSAGVKNPPSIFRVAVEDGYAVALWVMGPAGGTAVLRQRANAWTVLSSAGGFDSAQGLISQDDVPKKTAEKLASDMGMPGFAETTQQYQVCNEKAITQLAMDICASEELKRANADLGHAYGDTLSRAKSDPTALAKIVNAKRAWEAYREAYVDATYPAMDKQANYGSIYPMEVSLLRAKLARQQIKALTCLRLGSSSLFAGSCQL